tara:strand:- start:4700 stop:6922 length:2223 start_codon:yes stop_codon:yes gene_type:complete
LQKDVLFEIGTEEIPSIYLTDLLRQLEENTRSVFSEFRTTFSDIQICGTPRRMFVHVSELKEFQQSYTEEILGPPTKIAFDEEGKPTKAVLSFLKKNQIEMSDIKTKETPKGERIFLEKLHEGNKTIDILSSALITLITSLSSPKSMRWQRENFQFVRPIRWILALYGEEIIPLRLQKEELIGVASCLPEFSNKTYGHRFLSDQSLEVKDFDDYIRKLNENYVNPISYKDNPGGRFKIIEKEVLSAASSLDCIPALDKDGFEFLVEKVSNLVEWPKIVQCQFDERYLNIPEEVIVNTLESNQRFFALKDKRDENITSHFIAVSNLEAKDMGIIKEGYERVVQARLEDAEFYWEKDLAISLEVMSEKLNEVVYHPKLGTSMEKVIRFSQLSAYLCEEFYPNEKDMKENVLEISKLCKADLTSGMVYEFPELQGVMGKYFARIQGKNEVISNAIYEHYMPIRDGDEVPSSREGGVVSLSDRFDTIVGLIGLNYVPKGSEDPYALRRTTAGIFKILSSFGLKIDLSKMIGKSIETFGDIFSKNQEDILERLDVFFSSRVHAFLMQNTNRSDLVESILSIDNQTAWRFPLEALAKLNFLDKIVDIEMFDDCSAICKRIFNMTKKEVLSTNEKNGGDFGLEKVNDSIFAKEEERILFKHLKDSIEKTNKVLESTANTSIVSLDEMKVRYENIFEIMFALTVPTNKFFDNVLIMDDDKLIRENRFNLLMCMRSFFSLLCDFTKVQK